MQLLENEVWEYMLEYMGIHVEYMLAVFGHHSFDGATLKISY